MPRLKLKPDCSCMDCSVDTSLTRENYEVKDAVWRFANPLLTGRLCLTCLETRLGRPLDEADFTSDPMNEENAERCTPLLWRLHRRHVPQNAAMQPSTTSFNPGTPKTPLGRASAALLSHRAADGRVPLSVMIRIMRQHRFVR